MNNMGGKLSVYILSTILALSGCQTSSVSQKKENGEPSYTNLETIIQNWDQSLKSLKDREPSRAGEWHEEFSLLCSQNDGLCETSMKRSKKKERLERSRFDQAKKFIKEEKFDELNQYPVDFSLKLFGRMKESQLLEVSQILLKDQSCKTVNMRHGLASILEDSLPKEEVKTQVLALYESNSSCTSDQAACTSDKTAVLSSYRAAMLRLLENSCAKAQPLLQKVTNSDVDYLKARSIYWTWKCQGDMDTAKDTTEKLPYFSYHRILLSSEDIEKINETPLVEQTPVQEQSKAVPALNDIVELAQNLLAYQNLHGARFVLEKVRVEKVQEAEPEFQIFYSHLLHQSGSGIRKFQILSSLVNSAPQFRSKTVKIMLFPNQFFEFVEASTKKLDPWLVQALIRQESAFDPKARSRVGATGLMQLMPSTARRVARINRTQLKDPARNVQAGVKFLERLVEKFDGQVPLALAAYNAGPNKVEDWMKRYPTNDMVLFVDTIPYRETREYVAFILRNYHWYRSLNTVAQPIPTAAKNEEPAL